MNIVSRQISAHSLNVVPNQWCLEGDLSTGTATDVTAQSIWGTTSEGAVTSNTEIHNRERRNAHVRAREQTDSYKMREAKCQITIKLPEEVAHIPHIHTVYFYISLEWESHICKCLQYILWQVPSSPSLAYHGTLWIARHGA